MRIGLDARLATYRSAGIARYTRSLLRALLRLDTVNTYTVFVARGGAPLVATAGNVTHRALLTPPHHRFERLALGVELAPQRLDLLHSPDFIAPRLRRGIYSVITVHDLAFLRAPDLLAPDALRYYRQLPAAIARADAVIAVSESTRRDLLALAGAPDEKVHVIYEAADERYRPLGRSERLAAAARAGGKLPPDMARLVSGEFGPFILFVGTVEPRKNLATLFQAYRRYRDLAGRHAATLVLAGASGWRNEAELAEIERLRAAGRLVWFQDAGDDQVLLLYNAATTLVLPSRSEGFGLPALEAMACGTPVLAADTGSLPEVVGDAGRLLPPDDVDAWAEALREVGEDRIAREAAIAAGLKQAARFSWASAAEQTLALYQRAAGQEQAPPAEVVGSCRR